ncbi:MAG: alcohol dehydrogenase [Candidatus Bathyarchaeota archaeon B26-2]|nr:MAG: alcohol dehydrogenase [Candidatus Bathyarchaeota archaeon B26-2]
MRGRMRAAVLHKPLDMRLEEVEIPEIGPMDVLVRMRAVGVCGSDVHYFLHGRAASFVVTKPIILGHECAGDIAEVGSKVQNLEVGQRVVIEPGFTCGRCNYCRGGRYNLCRNVRFYGTPPYDGAFSEYAAAPAENVYPLPDNVSYEEGAMIEPLAVGMMAARRGSVTIYDKVAILGAGPIGQMALRAVKAQGVLETYVTDVIGYRLEHAERAGATVVINPAEEDVVERIMDLTGGEGVDVVIEASGAVDAVRQAFKMVRPGGRVVLVGIFPSVEIEVPLAETITKELDVLGVFRYANIFPTAVRCVSSGRIEVKSLITHKFPLERIVEGFETHIKKIGNPMKVQIII